MRTLLAALATALALSVASPVTAPATAAPGITVRPGFVHVQDRDFYLDGRPFRHVGANMAQLLYTTEDHINRELDFARANGIRQIRVFAPNDRWSTANIVSRLRLVADRASARGIRLTVALTDYFRPDGEAVYGWDKLRYAYRGGPARFAVGDDAVRNQWMADDRGFYNQGCGGGLCVLNHAWIHWGHTAYYRQFALDVAGALRDHPGIFAWEVGNEIRVQDPAIRGYALDFYRNTARAIKQVDPHHLVTTGAVSAYDVFGRVGAPDPSYGDYIGWADALYSEPAIDYVVVHQYYDRLHDSGQDREIADATTRWRKPVVVEEFAVPAGRLNEAGWYYSLRYRDGAWTQQADAVLYWAVSAVPATEDWGTEDRSVSPTPRVQGAANADWFTQLWRNWAGYTDRQNAETRRVVNPYSGKCVSAPDRFTPAAGQRLHLWDCPPDGNHNQINTRLELTASGELKVHGLCVDALSGLGRPGDALGLWPCGGGANQRWQFVGETLRGINGLCVDIANGNTANGAALVVWGCHGGWNQRWQRW
ncbi:MAG TPA: ricin-type beta-trefoil lectin domain protein [Pseudonocardiaceae bacterium]